MSKHTGHTPGPWDITAKDEQLVSFYISPIEATIPYVPLDVESDEHMDAYEAEALANARLIAAAPDLLRALQGLMEFGDEIAADLRLHTNPDPLIAAARAAIAKATAPATATGEGEA